MSTWRKSSRSNDQGDCVEARTEGDSFQVRDSKLSDESPIFDLKATDFTALLATAKRDK